MPVLDAVAADYQGRVHFVAIAGRSDLDSTAAAAGRLFSDNLLWGLDESIWDLYGVRYQPISFAITADGRVAETWYGNLGEEGMRTVIDGLIAGT